MNNKWVSLGAVILALQLLAFLSSYFVTGPAVNGWYQGIPKSALTPPDWVFAPVWTLLYTILAIALWRLWRLRADGDARRALAFFLVQLGLNYAWSFVFFGLGAFGAAFLILTAMVALTMGAMHAAYSVDRPVTWMLVPYLAWISFATYLTFVVMRLNG